VAEEFCWAMTKAEEQSNCSLSGSNVLEFGLQLVSVAYTYMLTIYILNSDLCKIRLVMDLPECNCYLRWGMCGICARESILITNTTKIFHG
jgi:hypothetical protein